VTGGPDLTLTEVSEASDIVYSAAHEDANIIFGAVVDPEMTGKVKITVIATGFDRRQVEASPAAQAQTTTPTDLAAYVAPKVPAEERLVANGGRVVVTRRPMVDLWTAPPAAAAMSASPDAPAGDGDAEDEAPSPLDVPAFLRRQES
jgi:cell division protein FtsZ